MLIKCYLNVKFVIEKEVAMVNKLIFLVCFTFPIGLNAQILESVSFHSTFEKSRFFTKGDLFAQQLMADPQVTKEEHDAFAERLDAFVTHLRAKRGKYKSELDFVSTVFYKTHRKFLKRYRSFTPFGEMFRSGSYDCLSATTLYAILLTRLDIEYEVVETNYHIYINVSTPKGNALIESTDPIYGYATDPKEIKERINVFNTGDPTRAGKDQYAFVAKVNDRVSMKELIGLQYYNASIHAYNGGEFDKAINLFQKALHFRQNERMNEFGLVMAQTILGHNDLTAEAKSAYINKIAEQLQLEITLASR